MSFFLGLTGLRHQYFSKGYADIDAATDATSAIMLCSLQRGAWFAYLDNTVNQDLNLYLVHPDSDATVVANRLFFIEIPANRVINYDFLRNIELPPKTRIYVSKAAGAGAATSGKLRLSCCG